MKYYELYKTASIFKNGLTILDVSSNLTDEEIREIDKIIGYKTVFSLENPSIQEIKEAYPKNYAFYQLKSFPYRKILFLSNYTGMANHTPNRPGNYFSHVIIFEEKDINFSFRKLLNSFEWKEILTLEEDNNYKPSLGTKELEIIDNDSVYIDDFNHFHKFLSENKRLLFFSKIIDYIFTYKILEKGQNITIIDSKDNLIDWVLCVNYFIPNDLAEQITFASYIGSPKESPFKLTAVIPECNIPSNDEYFVVFDTRQEIIYEPKHLYTKKLLDFIDGNNPSDWLSFVYETKNLSYLKLNEFLTKYNFIEGIGNNSSISEYKEKCFNLSVKEKKEIWSKAYNSDLNLYNEIVISELNNKMSSSLNIEDYKNLFSNIYIEFVENKEEYRLLYLDGLINTFLSEKSIVSNSNDLELYILLNSNCQTNDASQLRILLQKIETNFSFYYDDIEDNIETVTELDTQYNIDSLNFELPNIKKIMKFKEIIQEAKKGNFLNEIRKHNNFLQKASVKEKRKLFLIAFNSDKYFLKKNFTNFSAYIELINKNLSDDYPVFWADFFDDNRDFEKNKDYTYHSLGYLKKRFVADIFLSEYNSLQILEKMDFTNEYTMKWINEAVTEETDREAILNRFLDHFKTNRHIDNNSSWFSKLFKK